MLRDILLDSQEKAVKSLLVLGVIVDAERDEDGDYTGIYSVLDESSGNTFRCVATRCGNTKFIYPKGTQVIIGLGIPPISNVGCVILGQLPKEYPDEAKPPSDMALDEGEIGTKNPISGAGVYHYSDGASELRGHVGGRSSVVSIVVGGINNLFKIALNVKDFLISLSPSKVLDIVLNTITVVLEKTFKLTANIIELNGFITRIFADKTLILHSNENIGVAGKDLEIHGESLQIDIEKLAELVAERLRFEARNGSMVFISDDIRLGGENPTYHLVLGEKLIQWLRSHTHPVTGSQTGPPTSVMPLERILSHKVRTE